MQTREPKNLRLISSHDPNWFGNIGDGTSLQQAADGRLAEPRISAFLHSLYQGDGFVG
jgi:hypothetical protein